MNYPSILEKFSIMLDCGLSHTAATITCNHKTDLGSLMEAAKFKLDATVARANQNTDGIQDLQDPQDTALSKIDLTPSNTSSPGCSCCSLFPYTGPHARSPITQARTGSCSQSLGTPMPRQSTEGYSGETPLICCQGGYATGLLSFPAFALRPPHPSLCGLIAIHHSEAEVA